ncbi:hypothetical protein [Streptomyces sp. NPDC050856]|uniref:hypothetical protein n=1 Tax=Streptomyces sp. NPDC050856 TaxID=3154939 RepID=UPI003411EB94
MHKIPNTLWAKGPGSAAEHSRWKLDVVEDLSQKVDLPSVEPQLKGVDRIGGGGFPAERTEEALTVKSPSLS